MVVSKFQMDDLLYSSWIGDPLPAELIVVEWDVEGDVARDITSRRVARLVGLNYREVSRPAGQLALAFAVQRRL